MTTQQQEENNWIDETNYLINKSLIETKRVINELKEKKLQNVLKHHQAMLNLDYAYEITQRAIEQLTAAKHK